MSPEDARDLIAHPSLTAGGPQVWADLGCGDGTFTTALASLLPAGSTVHAIDTDKRALSRVPARHGDVTIITHSGDFTKIPWPFDGVDGVLMANALHYVKDQAAFISAVRTTQVARRTTHGARRTSPHILLVEYDTTRGNAWVPYPISQASAIELFRSVGYGHATMIGRTKSVFRRADIYGMLVTAEE